MEYHLKENPAGRSEGGAKVDFTIEDYGHNETGLGHYTAGK